MKLKIKQKLAKEWFKELQNLICYNIEQIEKKSGSKVKFKKKKWKHGEFRIIKGNIIEKGGVAFSNVSGKLSKEFAKKIPGAKKNTSFWSSGVSVVLHPKNPKIPAMHFNTRFICTKKNWFGGGMDMTPSILDKSEKKYFHNELKKCAIPIIKSITQNIKNGVMNIFIYHIEANHVELVAFFLIIKWIIGKKTFHSSRMWVIHL